MKKQYEVEFLNADTSIVEAESEQEAIEIVEARGCTVTGAREVDPHDPGTIY